ncbi:MAG: hypothetical protein DA328_03385 [Nitrososphaeraceae archaeon]|nr:hypothetical protein [Nitrososphaeraceae archaeon]
MNNKNLLITFLLFFISSVLLFILPYLNYGYSDNLLFNDLEIKDLNYVYDDKGITYFTGVIFNDGYYALEPIIGINLKNITDDKIHTQYISPYGKIVYPQTEVPFKFQTKTNGYIISHPFFVNIKNVTKPFYDLLKLDYNSMPIDDKKSLYGKVKNFAPFPMYNVSVYASVHSKDRTQIDSVKSKIIPIIKPNEEISFEIDPDNSIKSIVHYYSCAGLDVNTPITTLNMGNGKFITYDLQSVAKISNFRYENSTSSIVFEADHYNPNGGQLILKLPLLSKNQEVKVFLDGLLYNSTQIKSDKRTNFIDIFIPPKNHEITISGIK